MTNWLFQHLTVQELTSTEGPRYNDSVCYQRFEFAVIKKLNKGPSKAWITDSFEQFFYNSYVLCIC